MLKSAVLTYKARETGNTIFRHGQTGEFIIKGQEMLDRCSCDNAPETGFMRYILKANALSEGGEALDGCISDRPPEIEYMRQVLLADAWGRV